MVAIAGPARRSWETEELALLRESVRAFFEQELVPNVERWERQKHVDRSLWTKAGELGLLCASIPEEYGGGGGTFAHEAVLLEEQAHALDFAWGNSVHSGIVAHYVLAYGSEEQKRRWLPPMASGEVVSAIAMSEPGAGSDLQAITTTARRDGDHYVVSGAKTFITNGGTCDMVVTAVKTDPSARAKGVSLLLVDCNADGVRRGQVLDKIGHRAADTAEMFFDDVRVPVENLLGGEGEGFVQLMQQLPQERLIIGVVAAAGIQRAVELTTAYTKEREAFGGPLFDLQNTRFELAECATLARVGRVFVDDCIVRHVRGELDNATASMAKYWLSDVLCQVVDRCLQLHGGYGYMREYPIARMYEDARVLRIFGGANEVMKELIARSL